MLFGDLPAASARYPGTGRDDRIPPRHEPARLPLDYFPHRVAAVTVETATGPLGAVGVYVPSRDLTKAMLLEGLATELPTEEAATAWSSGTSTSWSRRTSRSTARSGIGGPMFRSNSPAACIRTVSRR